MLRPRLLAAVAGLLVALAVVVSPAKATQPECKAINQSQDLAYNSNSNANPLGAAITEAASGDTIKVIGICHGNFVITKELTFEGRSSDQHEDTIDGSGGESHAVLYGSGADMTVRDLTIRGGGEAGLLEAGAHLSVVRSHVTDNYRGVSNSDLASTTIEDSVINDNQGCGVVGGLFGSITISDSEVSDNSGCGVSGAQASVTISDSLVADNGGAGVAGSRHIQVSSSVIEGNTSQGAGGGIAAVDLGTLDLIDSIVCGNTASRGGGVLLDRSLSPNTITGSIVTGNTATEAGGGIYGPGEDLLSITNSTVSENTAPSGGGIFLFAHRGSRTEISNSTLSRNTASYGGGIYGQGALTIDGSTVSENAATYSGGGILTTGTLAIHNSIIEGNTGSGIWNGSGILTLDQTIVRGNHDGPAISNNYGNVTLTNSLVTGNSAPSAAGIYSKGTLTLINSAVAANVATGLGGGISLTAGEATLTDSTVSGNTASIGGGIWKASGSTLVLNGTSTVRGNTPDDIYTSP